ncbi:MAG: membrane protein insertion efficiency factor YidD [Verrucomicrobia bacterium]|nr:membrane protein insertion efficiency factor YidD [Verrucomicrobiota bacterium]
MLTKLLIGLIRIYQLAIRPLLGSCCRFYPSCSEYGVEALRTQGVLRGVWLIIKRLSKCQPWHPGGIDEVTSIRSTRTSSHSSNCSTGMSHTPKNPQDICPGGAEPKCRDLPDR